MTRAPSTKYSRLMAETVHNGLERPFELLRARIEASCLRRPPIVKGVEAQAMTEIGWLKHLDPEPAILRVTRHRL